VISPILIAILMVLGGAKAVLLDEQGTRIHFRAMGWLILTMGVMIILYSFMADSLALLPANLKMLSELKPTTFNWPLYIIGFVLIIFSVYRGTIQIKD